MTHRQRRPNARPAFTMIELLVVITIIAILVALLSTAVMRGLGKGAEVACSSEIGEMQSKLSAAARSVNYPFVPSRLHLSKRNNYANNPLDNDTKAYLIARFGTHTCCDFVSLPSPLPKYSSVPFIDWNGDGNPNEELFLEGEQCLVFHLGGVPVYSPANNVNGSIAMVGFSNDTLNPAKTPTVAGEKRQGPYFEFQSNRLVPFPRAPSTGFPGNTGTFPAYLDPWQQTGGNAKRQPFAFFASYSLEGGGLYSDATHKYGTGDCPSLPVLPYIQSASGGLTVYVNPSSFQIISAGRDGKFGAGGANWGRTGTTDPLGADDQSNFSAHLLGVAP